MSNASGVTAVTGPKINPPLEIPKSPPRVAMHEPDFEKLTTAEKLNDSNYRELIYQTYPDEPTCACESVTVDSRKCSSIDGSKVLKLPDNLLVCPSGCMSTCCSRMRQSVVASSCLNNANKNDTVTPLMPTYCVGNSRVRSPKGYKKDGSKKRNNAVHNGDCCCTGNRLRGGGERGEERSENGMYPRYGEVSGTMVRSFGDAWNGRNDCVVNGRLEGGGGGGNGFGDVGFEYVQRHPLNSSLTRDSRRRCCNEGNLSREYPRAKYHGEQTRDSHLDTSRTTTNVHASIPDSYVSVAAGCCCPGKESLERANRQLENGKSCSKKPCLGVDCLVKALYETQEFVESLGKVPGLAGLGLMDPAESPYFGRMKKKESDLKRIISKDIIPGLPNPQCTGPCNSQMLRSATGGTGRQSHIATPFTLAMPGRGGIVREAVPSMPGPGLTFLAGKSRRRDDKEKSKEDDPSGIPPVEIEEGPCGEPSCKAKRRKNKVTEDQPAVESVEIATKKVATVADTNGERMSRAGHRMKVIGKMRTGRRSSTIPGSAGDRHGRKRSSGRAVKKAISFMYSAGDTYSGVSRGHKNCIEDRPRVPGNMGWLWNLDQTVGRLKPRPGWKPGAISRRMKEMIREARANFLNKRKARVKSTRSSSSSSRTRSRSASSSGKRSKPQSDRRTVKKTQVRRKEEEKEEPEPPPTLHIHRKDGTYYVTMYPIKQDVMDVPKLEEPMKPLQFKIAKNKDDASVASSSTASDMEIEFSPPAAVNRYRKKPNVIHVETQVKQQEIFDAFRSEVSGKKKDKKQGKKNKK